MIEVEQITLDDDLLIPALILNKIRVEVADLADADAYGDYQQGFNFGLMRATQIIDKYVKIINECEAAESEDKE